MLIAKVTFLRIISPEFLALRLVKDSYQSDVRDLEGRHQEVWFCPESSNTDPSVRDDFGFRFFRIKGII